MAQLAEKCIDYFKVIDSDMIAGYRAIETTKQIKITEQHICQGGSFNAKYQQDIIKEMKHHYSDWDITYSGNEMEEGDFIFIYKGDPSIINPEPEPELVSERANNRSEILDLRR